MKKISGLIMQFIVLLLIIGGCENLQSPTEQTTEQTIEEGYSRLIVNAKITSSLINTLVIEITAEDIDLPLIFNIEIHNSKAEGTITVPVGSDRTITISAYQSDGIKTHQASTTIDIVEGPNPPLNLTLISLTGDVPIEVKIASFTVSITPPTSEIAIGDTVQLTATIFDSNGKEMSGDVQWGTVRPWVATVSSDGVVTGVDSGKATIVAVYGGGAGQVDIEVYMPSLTSNVHWEPYIAQPTFVMRDILNVLKIPSCITGPLGNNTICLPETYLNKTVTFGNPVIWARWEDSGLDGQPRSFTQTRKEYETELNRCTGEFCYPNIVLGDNFLSDYDFLSVRYGRWTGGGHPPDGYPISDPLDPIDYCAKLHDNHATGQNNNLSLPSITIDLPEIFGGPREVRFDQIIDLLTNGKLKSLPEVGNLVGLYQALLHIEAKGPIPASTEEARVKLLLITKSWMTLLHIAH